MPARETPPPDHYFSTSPRRASSPATVRIRAGTVDLELLSDRGVFSYAALDRGTDVLLRTIPDPPDSGDLLDLGCGWGAIACTVATRAPGARVWAVDVNQRALRVCATNAENLGLRNVTTAEPGDVPAHVRFRALYCNPPVRVGKDALHALLQRWLERLDAGAHAYLVMQRNLGSDSLAVWLQQTGWGVVRLRSRNGYRVLDVQRAPAGPIIGA